MDEKKTALSGKDRKFRIPVLRYLKNFTDIGSSSVSIVIMVCNISVWWRRG